VKRLTVLVVAALASSWLVHAQQLQTVPRVRPVQQMETQAVMLDPASLVGLTKHEVEARLGKASAAFARIWNYKQPKGTLHVRFSQQGIVSDATIDLEPRSSGRG
jgi:hypothetical protein